MCVCVCECVCVCVCGRVCVYNSVCKRVSIRLCMCALLYMVTINDDVYGCVYACVCTYIMFEALAIILHMYM